MSEMAKDPVIVTPFDDGGLISYRNDGMFLHTLNTREGLEREVTSARHSLNASANLPLHQTGFYG